MAQPPAPAARPRPCPAPLNVTAGPAPRPALGIGEERRNARTPPPGPGRPRCRPGPPLGAAGALPAAGSGEEAPRRRRGCTAVGPAARGRPTGRARLAPPLASSRLPAGLAAAAALGLSSMAAPSGAASCEDFAEFQVTRVGRGGPRWGGRETPPAAPFPPPAPAVGALPPSPGNAARPRGSACPGRWGGGGGEVTPPRSGRDGAAGGRARPSP